jgi:hypothetical protein
VRDDTGAVILISIAAIFYNMQLYLILGMQAKLSRKSVIIIPKQSNMLEVIIVIKVIIIIISRILKII